MKKLSKLLSLLLAMALCLSLAPAAFAAGPGSITVNDAIDGQTYTIYKIFDLAEGYEDGYQYSIADGWANFFAEGGPGYAYVHPHTGVDGKTYVTWVDGKDSADDMQAFAQAALKFATDNNIGPAANPQEAANKTVVFSDLDLGYYLIDSSAGALVALDTTDANAKVTEKNSIPEISKEVQEDLDSSWGETNTADTAQEVTFHATLSVSKDAFPYTLHDTMTSLSFKEIKSITVKGVALEAPLDQYYTLTEKADKKGFDLEFNEAFKNKLTGLDPDTGKAVTDEVVVTYTATLDDAAYETNGVNNIYMTWGEGHDTTEDTTTTYTAGLSIHKYDGDTSGESIKNLAATFKMYRKSDNKYAIVENGYVTGWADTKEGGTALTTDSVTGLVDVKGLDADTYYIEETDAPEGYNPLDGTITAVVAITVNDDGSVTKSVTYKNTNDTEGEFGTANGGVIDVPNYSGARLPSTGGIGTTIFYVIGGALVLGAVVLLITKKRMNGRD